MKEKCRHADAYKATRPPTCGCNTCNRKWKEKEEWDDLTYNGPRCNKESFDEWSHPF